MAHRLLTNDLIAIPLADGNPGIYWLRFFEGEPSSVAIVTEVPGNPSFSVTNAMARLPYAIAERFETAVEKIIVFEIWPRGGSGANEGAVRRVEIGPPILWSVSRQSEIEIIVGQALPELPNHEELYRRVLELGGGTTSLVQRAVFEALDVAGLPPPHDLFRCEHAARFKRHRGPRTVPSQSGAATTEVGRRFWDALTSDDIKACRFHSADWHAIADESVRILASGSGEVTEYRSMAQQSALPDIDRRWLLSLFVDPIVVRDSGYSNGQHRACAIRFSGAERAAIVTGYRTMGEVSDDWVYQGDG